MALKIKTIGRVLWGIIQFPFIYPKLYSQVMHAINFEDDG